MPDTTPRTLLQRLRHVEITPSFVVGVVLGALICLLTIPMASNLSIAFGAVAALVMMIAVEHAFSTEADPKLIIVIAAIATAVLVSLASFLLIRSELVAIRAAAAINGPTISTLGIRFDRGPGKSGTILVIPRNQETPVDPVPCPAWTGANNLCIDVTSRFNPSR